MPIKSHQSIIKKRWEPVTHAYQHVVANECTADDMDLMEPEPSPTLSLCDTLAEFKSLNLANWRVYSQSKFLHLTYYDNLDLHGIASLSFLIFDYGEMSLSIAKNGLYCEELSNRVSIIEFYIVKN